MDGREGVFWGRPVGRVFLKVDTFQHGLFSFGCSLKNTEGGTLKTDRHLVSQGFSGFCGIPGASRRSEVDFTRPVRCISLFRLLGGGNKRGGLCRERGNVNLWGVADGLVLLWGQISQQNLGALPAKHKTNRQKPRAVRSSGLGPELRRLEAGELAAPAAELGVRGPQLPGLPHRAAAGAPVHRGDFFFLLLLFSCFFFFFSPFSLGKTWLGKEPRI